MVPHARDESTPLASATPRELAALGCYWLDLWCLRSPRAATERIEVSAEGYTITRVTPDEDSPDGANSTRTVERYMLPHGFSGGRERVRVETRRRDRVRIEEAL